MSAIETGFAIAVPPDWEAIDLLSSDTGAFDATVAEAIENARRGGEHAQLLMLVALVAVSPSGQPLSAGLAVTFADRDAALAAASLSPASFGDADVTALQLPVGGGVRVRHVAPATALAGDEPLPMLRLQYLIHTVQGLLTLTFTTAQDPHADVWDGFFDAMAATCELT
jgi:hypothetical protein